MSTPINASNVNTQQVKNHLLPDEGPKAIPLFLDFSGAVSGDAYLLDAELIQDRGFISMIQTMYIDLSDPNMSDLVVSMGSGGQEIHAKAGTQGFYNVLVTNPPKLTFRGQSNTGIAKVQLINVAIPGVVWPTS